MLAGGREHQHTLPTSQRFYYSNYEYYNQFETLGEYQNDLSKLRFNNSRRSTTSIVLYDTHSSNYEDPPQHEARGMAPKQTHHSHLIKQITALPKTVEDFFYQFATSYHEHNYSKFKPERESLPKPHELIILYYYMNTLLEQFAKTEEQDFQLLSDILEDLKQKGRETRQLIENIFGLENREESNQLLERWFAFEQYYSYVITNSLQAQTKNQKVENFYLFQYCQYFRWLLSQVADSTMRSMLLAAIPYCPTVGNILHPLVIPLSFCLRPEGQGSTPRILFLNLDGRETYYNIRAFKSLPKEVRYISIFNEPKGSFISEHNTMENPGQDFEVDANYANLNLAHSELIFREARQRDQFGTYQFEEDNNVLLYPLNSMYLRRKCWKQRHGREEKGWRGLPSMDQEGDVRWLWDQRIANEVEQWQPQLIILSYNGSLSLSQQDFSAILRDLVVLSDHRVILFTNMTGLYKRLQAAVEESAEQQWQVSKVKLVQQFFSKYQEFDYGTVDQQSFFGNLSQFIKLSAGAVSLKSSNERNKSLGKYSLARRMRYVEEMSKMEEFQDKIQPLMAGIDLQALFGSFGGREQRTNRKENESWEKMVDEVMASLRSMTLPEIDLQPEAPIRDIFENLSSRQLFYRLKKISLDLMEQSKMITEPEFSGLSQGSSSLGEELMEQYLQKSRQKLVLQNLEHCRYRRAYVSEQESGRGRVKFFRFCVEEEEQILLERYTQLIVDPLKMRLFLINYRHEDSHQIMYGDISDRASPLVKVQKININLEQSFTSMKLQNKDQIIRVNYSHCFLREKLYLFWPQEWNLREEIRRKLLGLQYNPPHVNYMLQIQYNFQERGYSIDRLLWRGQENTLLTLPRKGCTAVECGDNRFYIFGGIYDSHLDYYESGSPISVAEISESQFSITQLPKRKDRHLNRPSYIRPKLGYRVQKSQKNSQEGANSIILSGGYGRSFTNQHSLQSYESYNVIFQFQGVKIVQSTHGGYRIVKLDQSIRKDLIGKYYVGIQGETEEKFSDAVKDWIVAEGRPQNNTEKEDSKREVLTVLEDQVRVPDFKVNSNRQYLFGWDRTIRQKIYVPHCWSPELQILTGGRLHIVNTSLRADKTGELGSAGSFVIPKQQDLISVCLDEDRLWMLANSPILKSLESKSNFKLYQGSLANVSFLLNKKELLMNERYEFRQATGLKEKTLYASDEKIYLLGGLPSWEGKSDQYREDYILERVKDKFKQRVRKLVCPDCSLELATPFPIKHKEKLLLYALAMEQRHLPTEKEGQVKIDEMWTLKIETLAPNEVNEEYLLRGQLKIYMFDWSKMQLVLSRRTTLAEPKIVKIAKYTRFSYSQLREQSQKVISILRKISAEQYQSEIDILARIATSTHPQEIDAVVVNHRFKTNDFQKMLSKIRAFGEERNETQNLELQELSRYMRELFRLLNKHLFERMVPSDSQAELYQFWMEDSSSRKVKYLAIGQLFSTRLRFLRIRYRQELAICLNQSTEEQLFFNANALECEEIVEERVKGGATEMDEQNEENYKISISYKA